MAYKRSKAVRTAEGQAASRCPPPCGKVRYLTRKAARTAVSRIPGGGRMRAYSGDNAHHASCKGFFHLTSYGDQGRVAFYREGTAQARIAGLPDGWQIGTSKEGRRWRYTVYVPGEEPMPSVYTYATQEVAQAEAIADVQGEARTA